MGFSEILLSRAQPVREKIFHHPFVLGLGDGTLPEEKFRFYLRQDYLFLVEYCRVLALAAAKAGDLATMGRFSELLHSTLTVEMDLHRDYSSRFGIGREELEGTPMAATTHGYTSHLLSLAWGGGLEEIAAGLLPCQWGYWELGRHLAREVNATSSNRYLRWIESYASPEYGALAEWIRALVDGLAEGVGPRRLDRMAAAFTASSRYELMFWDMAWEGLGSALWGAKG